MERGARRACQHRDLQRVSPAARAAQPVWSGERSERSVDTREHARTLSHRSDAPARIRDGSRPESAVRTMRAARRRPTCSRPVNQRTFRVRHGIAHHRFLVSQQRVIPPWHLTAPRCGCDGSGARRRRNRGHWNRGVSDPRPGPGPQRGRQRGSLTPRFRSDEDRNRVRGGKERRRVLSPPGEVQAIAGQANGEGSRNR